MSRLILPRSSHAHDSVRVVFVQEVSTRILHASPFGAIDVSMEFIDAGVSIIILLCSRTYESLNKAK